MLVSKQPIGRFDAMLIGAVAGQPSAQTRQPELTALYHAIDAAPERGLGLRMQELEALLKPSTPGQVLCERKSDQGSQSLLRSNRPISRSLPEDQKRR
jgi:hypothetical protein